VIMEGVLSEFKRFLRLKSILTEQSVNTYVKHCRTINNKQNLFTITRRWIEDNILLADHMGDSTKRFYLRALINFFDWLRMEGVRSDNPAKEVRMPPNPAAKHRSIDEQIIKAIFSGCRNLREYIIMNLYYFCGLRPKELKDLKMKDVDFITHRIEIREGKGDKFRIVPFPEDLDTILLTYIKKYGITDSLIKSERDGSPATPTMIKHLVYRLSKRINYKFSGYSFRHSCITHHWEHGLDPYALQALAGHSSINITRGYTRVTIGILQRKYNDVNLYEKILKEKDVDKRANVVYNPFANSGIAFQSLPVGR
jgi:integrase/recombinase XerD